MKELEMKSHHATEPNGFTYHLLRHHLGDFLLQVKGELDGATLLIFPFQFLVVLHPQFEGDGALLPVVLLGELHPHPRVLGKEGVVQEVFDGVSGEG